MDHVSIFLDFTTISCPEDSGSCTVLVYIHILFLLFMKRMSFLLLLGMMSSALVPLEEFREINYSKQYGLTHDPEVLDILDTVSKTKGVCMIF
jgi:hypothetical protein